VRERDLLILSGEEVASVLAGQELAIVETVRKAYQAHGKGQSSLPHSTFLNFPDDPANRIIALPSYLGGELKSAGVKWIASFPANLKEGTDRASAVLILNSPEHGRPKAILESSTISAWRTAASAALAAKTFGADKATMAGLVGCGVINFEIVRFLVALCPGIRQVLLFDLNPESANFFKAKCAEAFPNLNFKIAPDSDTVFKQSWLISFATTAGKPYVQNLAMCAPGAIVLHISLRDLAPEVILASDNIVDDVDHVCRAATSIHLTEQQVGSRNFVRCTLADILNEIAPARKNDRSPVVFSPFGLGILDLAVGEFVLQQARKKNRGSVIESFLPSPWRQPKADWNGPTQ
jgi:N-[(2S)-2-amino-2-carboxyethyl]-L-glutamate dehydrogenase